MDVATGRAGELPALEKRLHELEKAGDVDGPEYLEAHAKHEALERPAGRGEGEEDARAASATARADFDRPAREMSGGWVMRAHLARLLVMEPDLLHARRADEPPRPALAALAPGISEELLRRGAAHLARPRVHG